MKKVKGFTLVELIIVMAIFGILMAAIMRMFNPIRETYVDSTLYESQRTAQNGVMTYIGESVRFAAHLGIYNDGITTSSDAVDEFATAYCTKYSITDPSTVSDIEDFIRINAEVITIDNKATAEYGGKQCYGRLIRRKKDGTDIISDNYVTSPDKARLALGAPYYDDNIYSIGLDVSEKADGLLKFTVASTANHGGRNLTNGANNQVRNSANGADLSSYDLISTNGSVMCRNLTTLVSEGTYVGRPEPGLFDTDKYTGSSTIKGKNTYIVYINDDDYLALKELHL